MRRPPPVLIAACLILAACAGSDSAEDDTVATDAPPETTAEPATTDASTDTTEPATTESVTTEPPPTDPPTTEPPATDPPTTEPVATDPPEPALDVLPDIGPGEYAVGVQTIQITDPERDRTLDVDVTFPLAPDATGEPQRYTFITGDFYESPGAIAADATSISADGPFPLVVYSHGSGGLRFIHSNYSETLASHGYVVVAPDHLGNTAVDQFLDAEDDRATIGFNRPRDVQVLIDQMTDLDNPTTAGFAAAVDPEQIAVTGHSVGGYTTLAVASGMSNEAGSVQPDPRVDALIPLAPAIGDGDPSTSTLTADLLATIDLPILVMVGTNDTTTPPSPNVDRTVAETGSTEVYRVDLVDAAHQSFTDVCAYLDFLAEIENATQAVVDILEEFGEQGCSPGDMSIERVQAITNTFAIAFLDSVFGDAEMIDPAAFEIPEDVIYTIK